MTANTNHGKTSSAERNSGRKPKLGERDRRTLRRIVFENHRTAAAKVIELNIHLKTLFPPKGRKKEKKKKRRKGPMRTAQTQYPLYN
jgi:hypothetical protein